MAQRWLTWGLAAWGVGVFASEALASAGIAVVVATALVHAFRTRGEGAAAWARSWWPLWTFVAWAALAPLAAGRLPTGSGLGRLSDWAALPPAAWALGQLDPRRQRALAGLLAVIFLASCAVAGFQHFGVWPREDFFRGLEWARVPFGRVYETVPGDPNRFMGGGLIFHRLKFAHVGGIAVIAAAALGLGAPGRWRVIGLATAALGFASIVAFPYARAASVALAGGLCVALAVASPNRRVGLVVAAGALGLALAIGAADAGLRARFLTALTAQGSGDRQLLLQTGEAAVEAHPWVGVGLGRFRPALFAPAQSPQHLLEQPGKAHNEFLSMAAEVGLPGGAMFILLLGWLWWQAGGTPGLQATTRGTLAYFALLSQVHDPLFQAPFSMALVLALASGLQQVTSPEGVES